VILKNILELKKSINKHRKDLYRISKDKRLSDPEVLNKSSIRWRDSNYAKIDETNSLSLISKSFYLSDDHVLLYLLN
jgi:hypothetical protein